MDGVFENRKESVLILLRVIWYCVYVEKKRRRLFLIDIHSRQSRTSWVCFKTFQKKK